MARLQAAPPLICSSCGDEIVIAAAFLPNGALCADCGPVSGPVLDAPTTTNTPEAIVPPRAPEGQPRDRGADDKGEIGIESEACERAASSLEKATVRPAQKLADPRSFRLAPGAQALVVEVDEWVYIEDYELGGRKLLATPQDLHLDALRSWPNDFCFLRSVYRVVLHWCRADAPPFRDIGPAFDGAPAGPRPDAAWIAAREWATVEVRRLKARGPFSNNARPIPEPT